MAELPDVNFERAKHQKDVEKSLAQALSKLIDFLGDITEYNRRELFTISLFQSEDRYLKDMLKYLILNKKSIKRKHAKEILKSLEFIAKAVGKEYHLKKLSYLIRGSRYNSDDW